MYPSINIGSIALPTSGLIYIFGVYLCLSLIEQTAVRVKHDQVQIYTLGTVTVAAGIIIARILFVIEFWAAFQNNLLGIIWPLNSGYNTWGGIIFGIIAGFFYARWKQMPAAKTLDAIAPGILAGFIVISLADFLAGPGFGTISNLPWAISQFGIQRHPVQIYEIIFALIAFGFWWQLTSREHADGVPFLWATAVYSAGRLYVDAFRANALLTPQGYHVWQIVALIALVVAILLLRRTIPKSDVDFTPPAPKPNS